MMLPSGRFHVADQQALVVSHALAIIADGFDFAVASKA